MSVADDDGGAGTACEAAAFTIREVPSSADASTLDAIGRLRVLVWAAEGCLDAAAFPAGVWLDAEDAAPSTRHFVAVDARGGLAAAARLVLHASAAAAAGDRDVAVFLRRGALPFPAADLGRLVVHPRARRRGAAAALNAARVAAARAAGARAVIATASPANARLLLLREGFEDTGERVGFADRPGAVFHALWKLF
jgi:predicted GNAT family N-acyltransferase